MNCEEAKSLIEEFYDGELNHNLKDSLKNHMAGCFSCRHSLEALQQLDRFLEKSPVPFPAAAALDQKIKQALDKTSVAKKDSLWRRFFFGSIAIPKPILASAVALIIATVIGAHLLGRNNFYAHSTESLAVASPPPAEITAPPKIVEVPVIQIVEKPVVKEKIVTRVVCADRRKSFERKPDVFEESDAAPNNRIVKTGNFSRASLKGFQPLPEIKTRIIKEGIYEK